MTLNISDFEISDLKQLDNTDVSQLLDRLATQLQELNPSLDLKRGVFRDTVAYFHAVLEAAIRTNLERYQSARSLQKIAEDPTLADENVVNEVLSNWGVTRRIGTQAAGSVAIELQQSRSVVIPENLTFEANGKQYRSVATFTSRSSANQVSSSGDRLMTELSNGNWVFTIEVEAVELGADSKLNAGDLIVPNRSLAGYVTSYAVSTFTDGTNTETNTELINELQLGIAAKTLSNRTNMKAYLREIEEFKAIVNQSIVGYGDAEMLRDQHTVFPISFGGRVDWYVRTQESLQRTVQTVTATLISVTAMESVWQFSISNDEFPGFYEINNIRRVSDANLNSGFEVILDERGSDLTSDRFLPDIQTVAESAYSAFQTTTIRFVDTVTPTDSLTPGDQAEYLYDVTGLPLIADIQTLISSRDVRNYAADALIKAPIPCFTQITLTINKTAGDPDPNVAGIKNAIMEVVNRTGFIGRLDGSHIVDTVHNFITDDISVTQLDIFGRIRRPDGSIQYLRDSDSLVIPEQPAKMVTAKTVQFFTEVSDISVNVKTVIPTAK